MNKKEFIKACMEKFSLLPEPIGPAAIKNFDNGKMAAFAFGRGSREATLPQVTFPQIDTIASAILWGFDWSSCEVGCFDLWESIYDTIGEYELGADVDQDWLHELQMFLIEEFQPKFNQDDAITK